MKNKIVKCWIVFGGLWEEDAVYAMFENGTVKKLFDYSCDELFFDESNYIGLTEQQAFDPWHGNKDFNDLWNGNKDIADLLKLD